MQIRLVLTASDASAELVQLRQAESLGVLNDHGVGIWHVDADLDHRCGDERGELAGAKLSDHVFLLIRRHATVEKARRGIGRKKRLPFRELGSGRFHREFVGLVNQRIDDVGLAPAADLLFSRSQRPPAV